jgi:hypothetical protein
LPRWIEFISADAVGPGPLKFALGFGMDGKLDARSAVNVDAVRAIFEAVLKHKNQGADEARACAKVLDCETLKELVINFPTYAVVFFRKFELTAVNSNSEDIQNTHDFKLPP